MKSKLILSLVVVLGLALVAAVAGEKNVWVTSDGDHHNVRTIGGFCGISSCGDGAQHRGCERQRKRSHAQFLIDRPSAEHR